MIIQFSVSNFGPIKQKMTLSFEATKSDHHEAYYVATPLPGLRLLKLGIIYGPNASGKSTLLSALTFLKSLVLQSVLDKSAPLSFHPFLLDKESKDKNTLFELHFVEQQVRYEYSVELNQTHIVSEKLYYYPKNRQAVLYERATDPEKQLANISFGSTIKLSVRDQQVLEGNTLWNSTVLSAFTRTNVDLADLRHVDQWFREKLTKVVTPNTSLFKWANDLVDGNPGVHERIVDSLRSADVQIVNFRILENDVAVPKMIQNMVDAITSEDSVLRGRYMNELSSRKGVHFVHQAVHGSSIFEQELDDTMESRGTLKYYGLSALLADALERDQVLSIDEIETSLHPDLMKHFLLVFLANSKEAQLIATTHNIFLLDDKELLRPDAVWFTEKGLDGATRLYSLSDFDSSVYRKGQSLINTYKIGKLGARPQPGSIFLNYKTAKGGKKG